jgi:selenocysteine lyase/cysteine desulfurase
MSKLGSEVGREPGRAFSNALKEHIVFMRNTADVMRLVAWLISVLRKQIGLTPPGVVAGPNAKA